MSKKYFSGFIIISLIIQLSVVLFAIPPSTANAYGNGFTYSRSITIDHTKVPNTDQSNFPVLVSGTYSYLANVANGGKIQDANNAYDLGFYTNSDCSTGKMAWERETHATSTGAINYWVKVPTLTTASDYVFYMCYGNSSVTTDQSSATSVWDSNYVSVYHLPNGATLSATDSTSHAYNGTITSATAATGQIDGGGNFSGSNQYITLPSGVNSGVSAGTQITLSGWFKGSLIQSMIRLQPIDSNYVVLGWGTSSPNFIISTDGGTSGVNITNTAQNGTWHYVAGTWSKNTTNGFKAYLDGAVVNQKNASNFNLPSLSGASYLGTYDTFSEFTAGVVDDVRISNTARSADWIATEYNNQNSPSTFYTIGSEQTDTTAPVFSSVTPASSSSIKNVTSSSAIAFTTDEALASGSITITRTSGTTDGNSPHTCTLKGTALNVGAHTINLSDTTNSCTSDVSNLVSGTVYTFVLAGSDAYSNAATPITSTAVTFDNTAPTISEVTPVTTPTNDNTPNYTFTTNEAGTISYGGDCSSVTTSASSGSNTITFSTLADGAHSNCTIVVTDTAGNASNSLSVTSFTIDTTAPSAPGTPDMTAGTDTGSSSTDNITSNTTPDFTISCESGATVSLKESSTVLGTGTCSSSTVTITSSALSVGAHTIKALQTDPAGNVSADSSTLSITIATSPTITTQAVSGITATTVTGNGNITATGGSNATVRGFVYGSTISYGATTTESGSFPTGAFTGSITSLTCNTPYHASAYATNPIGTSYGSDVTFTTSPCIPTISTSAASSVATSTLTLNGSVTATGGEDATQSGFAYGTDSSLTTVIATSTLGAQTGTASFTENLTGLTPNTTYYFRAYATNSAGTGYGSILSTTTVAITLPTVTTSSASGVTDTVATLNGSIDTLGGENATARGFEWGHTIVYNATTTESGSHSTGAFTASLSSLTCATEYHFRGYAINSAGIGYGSDQTFTTSACPVVTPASSGGGGGGSSPPLPRTPEDGYVFFVTPNPTTNGFVTLHFVGGQDITKIQIADNPNFSPATYINYVTSANWTLQGGTGEKTLYAKFCNQYARCGETIIAKVMYAQPVPPTENTKTSFIENLIPDFIKKKPVPEPEVEQPIVKQEVSTVLEGDWKLLSNRLVYNFVLAPLPSDIAKLTAKFPELEKVFARLGITKISDLEKLKNTSINLPVIADKKNVPSEILVAEGGQGLITLGSSLALTSGGEVQQKIETIAGKSIVLSVKPESPAESIKGYLLFKRKPEKTAMEIPANSLVASVLLARAPVAQIFSETPTTEQELLVHSFEYTDPDGDGIFTAEISAPEVEGEYEVLTIINYKDKEKGSKELRMITVVDPEGYVYEKNTQGKEVRLDNVKVSIFSLSNDTPALWDASKYNQDNPQITDNTGKYSFLVPPGKYYITAEAKGYKSYKGDEFEVKEGAGVHFNIEMMENGSWFKALVDWKMLIIIIFGIALLVNFINDRRLRKQLSIK